MVILFGDEETALKKLLAKKSYDELRELVAELHPNTHIHRNPPKKEKKRRPAFSNHAEGC